MSRRVYLSVSLPYTDRHRFAHSSVSRSPNFFPPTASLVLLFPARRICFPSLPVACSQATTDRHTRTFHWSKFAKCRCFDFRYISFSLLTGYLWKWSSLPCSDIFRIMVMWPKRLENEILLSELTSCCLLLHSLRDTDFSRT